MLARRLVSVIALAFTLSVGPAYAAGPVPPCAGDPEPPFPAVGAPPNVGAWYSEDLRGWQTPACLDWKQSTMDAVAASAGRFEEPGGVDALLARFGAVSAFSNIMYMSQHGNGWRHLVKRAYALGSANENDVRADFTLDEMKSGRPLYLFMGGTAVNSIVYRMAVVERSDDKLTLAMENTSTLRVIGIPLLREGAGQFLFTFERDTGDVWKGYVMLRVGSAVNNLLRPSINEYETRALGMFRHFAGLPTQISD
jgi:hypothetical protein